MLYTPTKVTLTSLLTIYLLLLSINTRVTYIYAAKARIKVLRALRGHCQNKTLQQIDTTLGRSQPITLRPGRTFIQRESLMSIVT